MLTHPWNALTLILVCWTSTALAEPLDDYWSIVSGEDEASYENVVSLQQASASTILDETAKKDVLPMLEFRCSPGSGSPVEFRINWQRFISSFNTETGFQADGGKTTWLKLGVDRTNKITLSRSSADVEKLLGRLTGAKLLEVEIAPYSEASVFAQFDISTLDAALGKLDEACQ
jgi:hypothetical protein